MSPDGSNGKRDHPAYRRSRELAGLVNQSWCPVDDWFHVFGAGGGDSLYKYTLTSDWSNTVADADITTPRNNTSVETGVPVYDPLELMTDQTTGDIGFCIKTSEGYIAIQAPCTSTSEGSSGGGDLEPPIDEEPIAPDSSI